MKPEIERLVSLARECMVTPFTGPKDTTLLGRRLLVSFNALSDEEKFDLFAENNPNGSMLGLTEDRVSKAEKWSVIESVEGEIDAAVAQYMVQHVNALGRGELAKGILEDRYLLLALKTLLPRSEHEAAFGVNDTMAFEN